MRWHAYGFGCVNVVYMWLNVWNCICVCVCFIYVHSFIAWSTSLWKWWNLGPQVRGKAHKGGFGPSGSEACTKVALVLRDRERYKIVMALVLVRDRECGLDSRY